MKIERGLRELYSDPERAERLLLSRRRLLHGAGVLTGTIPFLRYLPLGLAPVALAQAGDVVGEFPELRLLNDRPLNAETPAHLLDDLITPADRLFIRNNGLPPTQTSAEDWVLQVDGEACLQPKRFSIAQLKRDFTEYSYALQLECGGNGRAEFRPRVPGNQWTTGAIGCPQWTGVRLRDVLKSCGIADSALYIGFHGADTHLSGDPDKAVISRGVPMHKAMEDESLIAYAMNGESIPDAHGAPLRLVCGGWPGSVSGKWLTGISIRDRVHDGAKMTGTSYRVPCRPVSPGESVVDEDMCIIESMPVKSLITYPESGRAVTSQQPVSIRGFAWAGDLSVRSMAVSIDFGQSWQPAELQPPQNRLAWQRWEASVQLPLPGYYEVWARAQDSNGVQQPMLVPGWNPKGYLNNASHRIALRAT